MLSGKPTKLAPAKARAWFNLCSIRRLKCSLSARMN